MASEVKIGQKYRSLDPRERSRVVEVVALPEGKVQIMNSGGNRSRVGRDRFLSSFELMPEPR